jgi:NAD-dependent deacetylase
MNNIDLFSEMLSSSSSTVFSGIPDFRGSFGIFTEKNQKIPAESVLHINFFENYPEYFYEFYKEKLLHTDAKPNTAHIKLAELERKGKITAVVTQNIDGLHTDAGSKNVVEMHGSIHRNICLDCGKKYDLTVITSASGVPRCDCGGIVRPLVTLYGEELDPETISSAVHHISNADMLIIAGTSLQVYPVAGLLGYFKGKYLTVINKTATHVDSQADLVIRNPVGEVFGAVSI